MRNDYDFYSYGQRMASEMDERRRRTADEIEREYGPDARLEFECGLSIALGKQTLDTLEETVPRMRAGRESYKGGIDYPPNLRNNSYFGGTGISHQRDKDGFYNEGPHSRR